MFYPFNQNRQEPFSWLSPNSSVKIGIDFIKNNYKNEILLSLFLGSRFGGLGSRSRRGAGAFELSGDELFTLSEDDLKTYISSTGDQSESKGHSYFSKIQPLSPIFKSFINYRKRFKKTASVSNWEDALGQVGSAMQSFRTKYKMRDPNVNKAKVDPAFVQEAIDLHAFYAGAKNPPTKLTKDAFGLPRVINFTSLPKGALTITPYPNPVKANDKEMRRASPLHITVKRDVTGRYYCNSLILWDGLKFLPDNVCIRIKKKGDKNPIHFKCLDIPGPDKLETFLTKI